MTAELGRRRKILFLIPTLTGGGAERVIVTLLRHLDRQKFSLVLAVVDMRKAVFRNEVPEDVELIDLRAARVRYALPKIAHLIRTMRPDVVFSTLGHLNLALAIIRPLLPNKIVYIARETTIVSHGIQSHCIPAVWVLLYRHFYKNHDVIVCQSRYMQTDLIQRFGLPQSKIRVINNPVDIDHIQQLCSAALDDNKFSRCSTDLVAVGRIVREKGFDILIEAISRMNDVHIHLTILGEGPLKGDLECLAESLGISAQVHFTGFMANPYPRIASADALVLSSRYEGFPNVVLEALACGTSVIAVPAPGGVREILANVPECIVAEEISPQSLADAKGNWRRGPKKRVSHSAIEPYNLDRIIGKYQDLFRTSELRSQ